MLSLISIIFTVTVCVILMSIPVYSDGCHFNRSLPGKDTKAYDKLKPLVGKRFTVQDPSGEYEYHIGICTSGLAEGVSEAGVVQIDLKDSKNNPQKVLGKYTSADIMAGTNWVFLTYLDGERYNSHCSNEARQAIILITCDPKATDDMPVKVIEENINKTEACYYLFEMAHPEVCADDDKSTLDPITLSAGSIVLIVFACVVVVYLLAGALYQRFVHGAKGLEQLPNYEFWKDFGNLQADGCEFVCRSHDSRKSSPYKGLGDDQLDPDERDDNLLPM